MTLWDAVAGQAIEVTLEGGELRRQNGQAVSRILEPLTLSGMNLSADDRRTLRAAGYWLQDDPSQDDD